MRAVSYTHLDVYKRQTRISAGPLDIGEVSTDRQESKMLLVHVTKGEQSFRAYRAERKLAAPQGFEPR